MEKFNALKAEVLREGGYFAHFYFDLHAKEAKTLQELMVSFVGKLTNEPGVRLAVGEVDEPLKDEEGEEMHSATAKVSMLVSNLATLARLSMTYAPIGIDIDEPLESKVGAGELQNTLMGIATTAQSMTKQIIQSSMSDEQKTQLERQMVQRTLLGRQLMKNKEAEPAERAD